MKKTPTKTQKALNYFRIENPRPTDPVFRNKINSNKISIDNPYLNTFYQVGVGLLAGPLLAFVAFLFDPKGYSSWQPWFFSLGRILTIVGWAMAFAVAVWALVFNIGKDKRYIFPLITVFVVPPMIMYIALRLVFYNYRF